MGFDLVSCLRRPRGGLWGTRRQCHDLVFECLGVWSCGLTFSLHFSALLVVWRCPLRTAWRNKVVFEAVVKKKKLYLRLKDSRGTGSPFD